MHADHRLEQGLAYLRQVEGSATPTALSALDGIAPDLARLATSFVYGELYSRDGLTLPERQLITIAALAALGNARPQLKFHIAGALHVGCAPEAIVEALIHIAIYAGIPAALNALFAARDVFAQHGIDHQGSTVEPSPTRYADGWRALRHIDGEAGERVIASLREIAPDLGRFIVEFAFGDIYTRPGLGLVQRELVTVAALVALGTATAQLKVHIAALINVGGSPAQAVETATHLAAYAGFPAAINAALCIRDALAERACA